MTISRRNAMKRSGEVVVAVATLPFLSTINPAQAKEDGQLFALYDEYRRLEKDYAAAENRRGEAAAAVHSSFRAQPTLKSVWEGIDTPDSPERATLLQWPGSLGEAIDGIENAAKMKWDADLAEAQEQAGVPVLEKKERAACDAWRGALDRFIAMRANTKIDRHVGAAVGEVLALCHNHPNIGSPL